MTDWRRYAVRTRASKGYDLRILAAILAAGRGQRFGGPDKMAALLGDGAPVLTQSARAMAHIDVAARIAVLRNPTQQGLLPKGFDRVICEGEMADSLRCAVAAAEAMQADALLVTLGDMPFVTTDLLNAVIAGCDSRDAGFVLGPDGPCVPACFPASWYGRLAGLRGDQGARALLRAMPHARGIVADAGALHDIDQVSDLPGPGDQAPSQPLS